MKEEKAKKMKAQLELQSIRVSRIIMPLILNQLGNQLQSTQAKKQDAPDGANSANGTSSASDASSVDSASSADRASRGYKNLSNTGNLKNRAKLFQNRFSYFQIKKAFN